MKHVSLHTLRVLLLQVITTGLLAATLGAPARAADAYSVGSSTTTFSNPPPPPPPPPPPRPPVNGSPCACVRG